MQTRCPCFSKPDVQVVCPCGYSFLRATDLPPEIAEYSSRSVLKRLPVKSGLHLQAHALSRADTGFARGEEQMMEVQGPSFPRAGELAFQQTEISPVLCASFLRRSYPFLAQEYLATYAPIVSHL